MSRRPISGRGTGPVDVRRHLIRAHGEKAGERAFRDYQRAGRSFQREQFGEARKLLRPLVEANPELGDVHELYGLVLYRLGRWDQSIDTLERFRVLSGSTEQHPVLMDAHRAEGNWADVEELWHELAEASPSAPLVVEGRIVRAGALADRGELAAAISVLEKGWTPPKRPQDHHLRRAYVLADLFERNGNIPRSRKLFGWIARHDPTYGDAEARSRSLG